MALLFLEIKTFSFYGLSLYFWNQGSIFTKIRIIGFMMRNKLGYRLLWERIRTGDETAFFDLYAALYQELVHFGIRTCGDTDLASEATDQVFVKIWEKRAQLERVDNVQSYLITFLKRRMLRLLEKQHKINTALQNVKAEDEWIEMPYEEFVIKVQTNEIHSDTPEGGSGKVDIPSKTVGQS